MHFLDDDAPFFKLLRPPFPYFFKKKEFFLFLEFSKTGEICTLSAASEIPCVLLPPLCTGAFQSPARGCTKGSGKYPETFFGLSFFGIILSSY